MEIDRRPLVVRTSVALKTEVHPSAGVGVQRRVRLFQCCLKHSSIIPLQVRVVIDVDQRDHGDERRVAHEDNDIVHRCVLQGPLFQEEPFQAGSVTADVLGRQLHEEVSNFFPSSIQCEVIMSVEDV